MEEGDFIITPSWTWHDHGNDSDRPMVWMDGLDIPLIQALDCSRSEEHTFELQSLMRISYVVFCLNKNRKVSTVSHHAPTCYTQSLLPYIILHNFYDNLITN